MRGKLDYRMVVVLLVVSLGLAVVTLLKIVSDKHFAEGNLSLYKVNYLSALNSYKKARYFWPFIKNNPEYANNLKTVETSLEDIKNGPFVTIFLRDGVTELEIEELSNEIESLTPVKRVKIISQQEAYDTYLKLNNNDPLLVEAVSKDVLPISIEVYASDFVSKDFQDKITALAKKKFFVEEVMVSDVGIFLR